MFFDLQACGILLLQPGIEPTLPVMEVQNLNHWTAQKSLKSVLFFNQRKGKQQ